LAHVANTDETDFASFDQGSPQLSTGMNACHGCFHH
jgi:hypothetical protein